MKIEVIVPVITDTLFPDFLASVEANTVLPQRILLIDNTPERNFHPHSEKVEIVTLYTDTGKVNESWNLGVKNVTKETDFVGIYNDDILLNRWFFQRIIETFSWADEVGVACPHTIPTDEPLKKRKPQQVRMKRREGWCFTFRKRLLDTIPRIPDNIISTWNGDDFYWAFTYRHGYYWAQDLGNTIHHLVGASVRLTDSLAAKKSEARLWNQIRPLIESRKEFNQK